MKQENRPPRILYWKWMTAILTPAATAPVSTTSVKEAALIPVFICTLVPGRAEHEKTHDAVLDACRLLHARGKS